jgi:ribosomal protein S18 acetylase RimI-like enzyme
VIVLRPITAADDAVMLAVFVSSRERDLAPLPDSLVTAQYDIQRRGYLGQYPAASWSAIDVGDETVGRVIIDRSADPWVLVDLAVQRQHRNRGIGSRVLEDLLDEAGRHDVSVVLSVLADNTDAQRLYERHRFFPVASEGAYMRMKCSAIVSGGEGRGR